MRDLVNQMKTSKEPNYCVRVTARDGALGDQFLRTFQDNEKTIPTILTTSQKLSTGVDARNVRNIVLMRPINSMIEFKQIIGRGTRLFDGKDYFTIYDFVKAYEHFNDPEWDGEPVEPVPPPARGGRKAAGWRKPSPEDGEPDDAQRPRRSADQACRWQGAQHPAHDGDDVLERRWQADVGGRFVTRLFGELPALFKDEDELRALWSLPDTRKALLDAWRRRATAASSSRDRAHDRCREQRSFDVLAYIAFALAPITRQSACRHAARRSSRSSAESSPSSSISCWRSMLLRGEQELDQPGAGEICWR